jgi:hypothetical protein
VAAPLTEFPEPDSLTREQVLRARGLGEASAGREVEASPARVLGENSPPTVQIASTDGENSPANGNGAARRCPGCGVPITGHVSKIWCSPRCRKAHTKPQVATGHLPTGPLVLEPQKAAQGLGFLDQLVDLADQLPNGVRVELAAGQAYVRWSPS